MKGLCAKNCPGCGMVFSPDPAICPIHVFDDWRKDIEFADDPEGWKTLQERRASVTMVGYGRVIGYLGPTLHYYGCVKCQKYHFEGEPLYRDHIWNQSKEGIQEMPVSEYEKYCKK